MQDVNEDYFSLEEESIDYKSILYRLLSNWYWFVLCVVVGLAISYFANKNTLESYNVNSSLVLSDEKDGGAASMIFDQLSLGNKQNIENQIGILKSFTIIESTLENLNWRISLYEKLFVGKRDLYTARPLSLKLNKYDVNLEGIEIVITPKGDKYNLLIHGINPKTNLPLDIDVEVAFSKVFKSEYFNFTISKNTELLADKYVFIINNLQTQALYFQERLLLGKLNKKADIISLSMVSTCVERDVDFINELSRTYILLGLGQKNMTSKNTVDFIDGQLIGLSDSLKHTGRNFTNFRSRNKTVNVSMQAEMILEKLKDIEKQKAKAEMGYEYYRNLQTYIGDAKLMHNIIAPSVVGILDAGLNSMLTRLSELYAQKSRLEMIAMPSNPSLILLDKDIENIISSLEENLNNLVRNTKSEILRLKNRTEDINIQLTVLPSMEQKLISIKRRFDLNNDIYNFLLKKRSEAAISMAANVSDARVLDLARVATSKRKGPRKMINYCIGVLIGLIVPALLIFMCDMLSNNIKKIDDIESKSTLRILATIMYNNYENQLPTVKYMRSGITESFRSLRTNIYYLFENTDKKVIAIHSAVPGEGKSFVALNLACVLASSDKKTILIGADLRKPRLHEVFNNKSSVGLSKYLYGNYEIEDVIVKTEHEHLYFLPSGSPPLNPAELLQTDMFKNMITKLRETYDYIVIDNAPVSIVTDGFIVSALADLNLFLLRYKFSSKENVKFIDSLSKNEKMKNVALLFNGFKPDGLSAKSAYYGSGYYVEEDKAFSFKKLFARK